MKQILFFIVLCAPFIADAQKINRTEIEPKKNQEILIGYCNQDGFKLVRAFDSAYAAEYAAYPADPAVIQKIQQHLKGLKITIVMGSWCGDSREWVPRFYRIMDKTGFDFRKKLTIISVDRDKKAPGTKADLLKIERVPTFIFYRNHKELGRIVETPMDVFEKEILRISSIGG
jgi:thiol-disulfide isomerase/thioredoxin